MNQSFNSIYEDFADIFVDYISLVKSENRQVNYHYFKDYLAENTDFNTKLTEYLSDIDITPIKTMLVTHSDILKIYVDKSVIVSLHKRLDSIADITEISELISMVLYALYCHYDKLNNSFHKLFSFMNDLNSKISNSQKKMIHTMGDNISDLKTESQSDQSILDEMKAVNDVIGLESDVDALKDTILGKMDSMMSIVEEGLDSKHQKINRYEKVVESMKLDLSIYEKQTKAMENEIQKAKKDAITDDLTGLYTEKMLEHRLEEEFEKYKRNKEIYSILSISIKNMAPLLDEHGSYVIEYITVHITKVIKTCIRKIDIPFKTSQNEFLLLLPATDLDKMSVVANRIADSVKQTIFNYRDLEIQVVVCLGGTELIPEEELMNTVNKAKDNMQTAINSTDFSVVLK